MSDFQLEININTTLDFDSEQDRNKAEEDLKKALEKLNLGDGFVIAKDSIEAFDSASESLGKIEKIRRVEKYLKKPKVVLEEGVN